MGQKTGQKKTFACLILTEEEKGKLNLRRIYKELLQIDQKKRNPIEKLCIKALKR